MKNCASKTYEEETRGFRKMARHINEVGDVEVDMQIPLIDCLIASIKHRLNAYRLLCTKFGFLSDILNMSTEQRRKSAS